MPRRAGQQRRGCRGARGRARSMRRRPWPGRPRRRSSAPPGRGRPAVPPSPVAARAGAPSSGPGTATGGRQLRPQQSTCRSRHRPAGSTSASHTPSWPSSAASTMPPVGRGRTGVSRWRVVGRVAVEPPVAEHPEEAPPGEQPLGGRGGRRACRTRPGPGCPAAVGGRAAATVAASAARRRRRPRAWPRTSAGPAPGIGTTAELVRDDQPVVAQLQVASRARRPLRGPLEPVHPFVDDESSDPPSRSGADVDPVRPRPARRAGTRTGPSRADHLRPPPAPTRRCSTPGTVGGDGL